MKVYQQIASCLQAIENCRKSNNQEWLARHAETIKNIVREYLPHGSGIDGENTFDFDGSEPNRLVFGTSFHHMNDGGMYDGWTDHTVVVTPDLATGFDLHVTGRDRNEIKEYLAECFGQALDQDVSPDQYKKLAA
jgi:hypothetical protein